MQAVFFFVCFTLRVTEILSHLFRLNFFFFFKRVIVMILLWVFPDFFLVCLYFSSSSGNVSSRKDETNARDTYVSSFPRAPSTSDSVRLKCREMLAAALRTGGKFSVHCFRAQSFGHHHHQCHVHLCLFYQQHTTPTT